GTYFVRRVSLIWLCETAAGLAAECAFACMVPRSISSQRVIRLLRLRGKWQCKVERAAFTGFAVHPDLPAVCLHDSLADRQSKTGAACSFARLPEWIEEVWHFLRRDAWTFVLD